MRPSARRRRRAVGAASRARAAAGPLRVSFPGDDTHMLISVKGYGVKGSHKDGTILEIERRDPNVLPEIEVFREGECNVEELALQLAREERSFLLRGPPGTGKSHLLKRVLELVHDARLRAHPRGSFAVRCRDHSEPVQASYAKGVLQRRAVP